MAKQAALTTITSANNTVSTLNSNFTALNTQLDNTVSRDGSTPNTMTADLDLNSNDLLNAAAVRTAMLYIAGEIVNSIGNLANWAGEWTTATVYEPYDIVYHRANNTIYRCLLDHTSDVFATDLTAVIWEVYIGSGLIDQTAVTITGGTITGITDLAIADGGTGSSTAADARTALGLAIGTDVQAWDTGLDDIAGIVPVAGDILYHNGANWVDLPLGTTLQVLRTNAGATAPEWFAADGVYAPVETVTEDTSTTRTLTSADFGGGVIISANNALAITYTLNTGLTGTKTLTVIQRGAGAITFSGTATIISKDSNVLTNGQGVAVSLIPLGSDVYSLIGDLTV